MLRAVAGPGRPDIGDLGFQTFDLQTQGGAAIESQDNLPTGGVAFHEIDRQ